MIEVFAKGIAVGFAIAVPVGPIGLLCIRRSMAQGRWAGLATGLGAAAADGTYGLLVAAGVAATGVLVTYASEMQLFGGILIALIGLLTARSFLRPRPVAANLQAATLARAFGSTYVLTLSNPMTIIAFTGMIAGIGATTAGASAAAPFWLVLGVFLGSALWWLILVQLALWARKRMTGDWLRWLDLIAGAALVIWGAVLAFGALQA